ncbi:MAG: hypothetical protein HY774_16185 [Acidobacteria bacterium]|nr:hypothetical protein [Acidobacteriota bacterium]
MNQLIIKTEGKPIKCEICHQSDVFDVATQVCLRCRDLASVPSASKPVETFSDDERVSFFRRVNRQYQVTRQEEIPIEQKHAPFHITALTFFLNWFLFGVFQLGFNLVIPSSFGESGWLAIFCFIAFTFVESVVAYFIQSDFPVLAKGVFNGLIFFYVSPFLFMLLLVGFSLLGVMGSWVILLTGIVGVWLYILNEYK